MKPQTPDDVLPWLEQLTAAYPRFDDGRIDYTHTRVCPVVTCITVHDGAALLTHRSDKVQHHAHTWSGVGGFMDELVLPEEMALRELEEEVGIEREHIARIERCCKIVRTDHANNREWHIFMVLVEVSHKPPLRINWENKEARWVPFNEVKHLALMPGYLEELEHVLQHQRVTLRP
jgi:ADP-ribose pyrophosphatase YjhB (NUDIX family)